MPLVTKYSNDFDFSAVKEETRDHYGENQYYFLKDRIVVIESYSDDSGKREIQDTKSHPICEFDNIGLCFWDGRCWMPVSEKVAKAYMDCIAERAILKE